MTSMNSANIMNQLSAEQSQYQGYLDRGKQAMNNFDIDKTQHDALDQSYKTAKNLGKQLAEQAVGEKTMQGIEQGALAAPGLYHGVKVGRALYGARQSRLNYENISGKKFNLKQARANQTARAKTQAQPSTQETTETNETGGTQLNEGDDLQARLDALRRDEPPETRAAGAEPRPGGVDEFGLPEVEAAPAEAAAPAAEAPSAAIQNIRGTLAEQRASLADLRQQMAEAGIQRPTTVAPEAPVTTETGASAPGDLRPSIDPREAFRGDTGMQEGTLGRTPLGHTEVYNPRAGPQEPVYDPIAEREARFTARLRETPGGADYTRGAEDVPPTEDIAATRGFPAPPQAPVEATQQVEAPISRAPTEAAQSFQERSAQQLSRVGAESQQEAQMQGARAGQQSAEYRQALQQRQQTMEGEGYKPVTPKGEPGADPVEEAPVAPEAAEGGGLAAAEEAEAGALAGAEAAESAIPGVGELLMGATAIGGAIYAGITGEHEKKPPSIPPPPPMPGMPHMANIAFASAPVIDSASYHAL
jgi:hypothetical protein